MSCLFSWKIMNMVQQRSLWKMVINVKEGIRGKQDEEEKGYLFAVLLNISTTSSIVEERLLL